MQAKLRRGGWGLALVLAVVGCTAEPEEKKPANAEPEVTLQAVTFDELTKAIGSHKGKVVVVDVWASWCGPCMKEFPHLVQLHRDHAAEGLVCISASMDDDEEKGANALSFLRKQKATFANYRCAQSDAEWFARFDLEAIPAVFVFDREGKQAKKFTLDDPDNQFDYEKDVIPLVRKLLKAK